MTKKEKEAVSELCKYAVAVCNGHSGVKEILRECVNKVKPFLTK